MNPHEPIQKDTILIVDSPPAHLALLNEFLRTQGHRTQLVRSGESALQTARQTPPDLILMDTRISDLNSFEFCRQLQADPALKEVPVLFVHSLNEREENRSGASAGKAHSPTQPFASAEVAGRVRSLLDLNRQRRELRQQYESLKELEKARDSLVQMVAHDLQGPLSGALLDLGYIATHLREEDRQLLDCVARCRTDLNQMTRMIRHMLEISRLEAGQMPLLKTAGDLPATCRTVASRLAPPAQGPTLRVDAPAPVRAHYDEEVIQRVLANLIENAFKVAPNSQVTLRVSQTGPAARVTVTDHGPGIPKELHQRIFEKYVVGDRSVRQRSFGLGLAFCRLAIAAHGGEIGVESEVGHGSTFWFTLPASHPPRPRLPRKTQPGHTQR